MSMQSGKTKTKQGMQAMKLHNSKMQETCHTTRELDMQSRQQS